MPSFQVFLCRLHVVNLQNKWEPIQQASVNQTFSADDLITALLTAQHEAPERRGLTSNELVLATGMPRRRILDQLRLLKGAGRLMAEQELRPGLDDKPRPTSVYRIKP